MLGDASWFSLLLCRQLNSYFSIDTNSHFIVSPLSQAPGADAVRCCDTRGRVRVASSTLLVVLDLARALVETTSSWIRHLGCSTRCLFWFPFSTSSYFPQGRGLVTYLRWFPWCLGRRFRGTASGTWPCPCSCYGVQRAPGHALADFRNRSWSLLGQSGDGNGGPAHVALTQFVRCGPLFPVQ